MLFKSLESLFGIICLILNFIFLVYSLSCCFRGVLCHMQIILINYLYFRSFPTHFYHNATVYNMLQIFPLYVLYLCHSMKMYSHCTMCSSIPGYYDWNGIICYLFRLYVHNFWSQEKRLPTATFERMLMVLRSLYTGQIERCFLSLATNLLLEMTSQSPDFKRNMFEYPLSECTFQVSGIKIKKQLYNLSQCTKNEIFIGVW